MPVSVSTPSLRRRIRFHKLEEVPEEARRLVPDHQTLGNWSLAQICRHLADTLNASIDGMDLRNHRWKRRLAGPLLFRYALRQGIPRGYTVDPALTPPQDLDLGACIADLERATARYLQHTGPLRPHALFGRLSPVKWDRLHLLHAAHHLSYVLPIERTQRS